MAPWAQRQCSLHVLSETGQFLVQHFTWLCVHGKIAFIRAWQIPSLLFVPLEDVSTVSKWGVVIFLSLSHKTSAGELKGGEFLRIIGSDRWKQLLQGCRLSAMGRGQARQAAGSQPRSAIPPSKQHVLASFLISQGFHLHTTADLLPAACSTHSTVEKLRAGDPPCSTPYAGWPAHRLGFPSEPLQRQGQGAVSVLALEKLW